MKLKTASFSLLSVILLSACATNPNYFPDGYKYHGEPYKSAAPGPSSKVTKAQRKTMGPEQAEQFRMALYDLTDKLTERAGLPPKAVYVKPHDPMNAFYAQVDNDLREAMRHLGYTLAAGPDNAYVFTYHAELIEAPKVDEEAIADLLENRENVEIILQVFTGVDKAATQLTEERGAYRINGVDEYLGAGVPKFFKTMSGE